MNLGYHHKYPYGIMFHRFYGPNLPKHQGSISSNEFENLLLNIGIERILNPKDWMHKLSDNTLKDHHVCLTFDDCLKSQILVAEPILKKYKLSAFFFVHSLTFFDEIDLNEVFSNIISTKFNTIEDFMGEFLSFLNLHNDIFLDEEYINFKKSMETSYSFYSECDIKYRYLRNKLFDKNDFIELMKKYFTKKDYLKDIDAGTIWMNESDILKLIESDNIIGLHSYSHHINFKDLSYSQQLEEYQKNIQHLESLCGYKILSASHPLGSYNHETLNILSKLGIECAFRSNNLIPNESDRINPNKLELARVDVCDIIRQR